MSNHYDPQTCDLKFTKGTIYNDLRELGGNVYRDIKMSLILGTSSDLVHYLKKHSKLLKGFTGNEIVEQINKGLFSTVYLVKNHKRELVVKRSHDGWMPLPVFRNYYVPIPRFIVGLFFTDYSISDRSLKRDVYDYEKIVAPFWGEKRAILEGKTFRPYINMALHMVDHFLPEFTVKDLYSKKFWKKLLGQRSHKNMSTFQKYLKSIKTPKQLIPPEERFILFDSFTGSLQTIFIQEAMTGKEDIIPGKKMAFPCEMVAAGVIPKEMPKLMIEHLLRSIESFVEQLSYKDMDVKKVPDFRPMETWKIFPPTPFEIYIAETDNLVAHVDKNGEVRITFVDTHILLEPEGFLIYKWVELRYWISLFLNLRFWVRKALDFSS